MTIQHGNGMIKKGILSLLILAGSSLAGPIPQGQGAELLSDEPMETKVQTAPPNVMFILDNSGSMDWEVIVDDGEFSYHEYLYSPGDNIFSEWVSNGNVLGHGDASEKLAWKSQWSEYNKIYFNPHSNYEPWPDWELMAVTDGSPDHLADLVNPRSNPIDSGVTQNIHIDYYSNLPTANYVVADNDNSDDFSTTGHWSESDINPEWLEYSVYTNDLDATATFTPLITEAGAYQIYAYWNCFDNRDRKALITVDSNNDGTPDASERRDQHATKSNTPEAGVCGEWLPLFGGADFTFASGRVGSVSIKRDSSSTGSSTIADAIAFVPAGSGGPSTSTMDIKLAHYYVTNDTNDNQIPEVGEVYLVNFVWTDANADNQVDDGEVVRDYYLPYFTGSDKYQKIQYVTPVEVGSVPDIIIPKYKEEDGSTTNKTAIQELQNFANWFSFYRRRELTAKAAISRTISDLEDLYVGYYTINSGLRQPVLPIKVEETETVIVSAGDSEESRSSGWSSSGRSPQYEDDAYYTNNEASMTFAPNLTAGEKTVYGWWPCYADADRKAQVSIVHASGTTNLEVNQQADYHDITTKGDCFDSTGSGCCGYWVDLGAYTFDSGTGGTVTVERTAASTDSTTYSNAVKVVGGASTNEDKIDELLDGLYSVDSSGGTPLRTALQNVGHYYDDDEDDGNLGPCPFYSEDQGGACQQTYAIVMSDGYWNGSTPSGIGHQDQGEGAPYEDGWPDTLADVAWKYYDTDLSSTLPDELATNNWDNLKSQHMVTFAIAFGLDGKLDKLDLNGDGVPDNPNSFDDPYFLDPNTPTPTWPNPAADDSSKIDDMWHAAVNGRGEFFSAKNPDTLVASLKDLFSNISARGASGASVSVNGHALTSTIALFQSSYSSGSWEGDVTSYPININTGEVLREESSVNWHASDQLQGQDWDTGRNIITYDGTTGGKPFRDADLTENQSIALLQDADVIDYIRGKEVVGFRSRNKKLGDIVHSAPLLVPAANPETDGIDNNNNGSTDEAGETGGVIFAGGNDGMLHAFDAHTGSEVMAYVPHHNYYRLHDLTDIDFKHRFYVDATPSYKRMSFLAGDQSADGVDNDGDGCFDNNKDVQDNGNCEETADGADEDYGDGADNNGDGTTDEPWEMRKFTMLVGGLNKGGKGIYALNISDIESAASKTETELSDVAMWEYPSVPTYSYGGDQTADGVDNDLDTTIDEADEDYSDGLDNDGDGIKDEAGELIYTGTDDDMGYTFSSPFIVKSYKSSNEQYSTTNSPWVVIFGNGYDSVNGSAVLYIVDAFSGDLIRKIDTGAIGGNGLSETAIVDVNNDDRADFVYAGDLKGNIWKFDLTDPNPDNWGVAFGADNHNPAEKARIDAADNDGATPPVADIPQPLFSATGQPITTAPDVMHHPSFGEKGYLVVFGTGKFLAEGDRTDNTQQTIYSVWDYGTDPSNYLGTLKSDDTLSNLTSAQLLEQTEIDFRYYAPTGNWLRTLSDNSINWYTSKDCRDKIDNDTDGSTDEDDEICGIPISPIGFANDKFDNNLDGQIDEAGEEIGHAGWYFNLPYGLHRDDDGLDNDGDESVDEPDEAKLAGERVIKNTIIRDGRVIVISFIPDDSPCSGGGNSILHEMNAVDGGRLDYPVFDVNGDGRIDDDDMITVNIDGKDVRVAVTGRMSGGMMQFPVIAEDLSNPRELKILGNSSGSIETLWEKKEEDGIYYWRER